MTRIERIIAKIESRCVITPGPLDTPCKIWTGPHSGEGRGGGYGRVSIDGETMATHRTMFACHHGPIPKKKEVEHLCRTRLCCEILHLEMLTRLQNERRKPTCKKSRRKI